MATPYEMVREFHEAFKHPIGSEPLANIKDEDLMAARIEFMREELEEYVKAATGKEALILIEQPVQQGHGSPNVIEMADALADLVYFAYGAAVCFGIDLDVVFEEVHNSNMRKLQPDGTVKYRYDGKVVKPDDWSPPRVAHVLGYNQHGNPV
jgi:predicted HAD superfamily Cof-like phosphohydrolase